MTETLVPIAAENGVDAPTKRLFIKTYGCQMNVYDSERMADVLRPLGYAPTETPDDADFAPNDKFDALPTTRGGDGVTAFLTVQEGCDKFCTFCVVPYTRGAEWSRPLAAVLVEARALADRGVREVTLLGQNVNAYDGERADGKKATLAELAHALADIPGLDRIRYTTSHPNDMSDDLIAAHGDLDALMPYLHLPVQSGSDRILRLLNRKHGRQKYFDLIERIRAARPDMALSGDFIVGFPGETERDFEDTMDLVRRVNYASAFSFMYSPRPGTPAAGMGAQVPPEVAKDRLHRLQALLLEQQVAFNAAQAGRTLDVLFEKKGRHGRQAIGRSPYLQSVHVDDADHLIGKIVPVEIVSGQQNSLTGKPIAPVPSSRDLGVSVLGA